MRTLVLGVSALLLTLGACASDPKLPAGPPSLDEAAGQPAPPQARLYADCIVQAAGAGSFDREGNTLRFRCTGAPARAFYDGLAAWSAKAGSEITREGRTWRFSQRIQRDPSGVDFCVMSGPDDHRCTVVLNVGEFLDS